MRIVTLLFGKNIIMLTLCMLSLRNLSDIKVEISHKIVGYQRSISVESSGIKNTFWSESSLSPFKKWYS